MRCDPSFFRGSFTPAPFCPALLFIQVPHEGARSSRSTGPTTIICITHLFHFFYLSALPTTTTTPPRTCWTPQTRGVYFRGELSCAFPPLPITGRPRDVFLTLQPSRHTGASRQPTAPASSSFSFPSDAAGCLFLSSFRPHTKHPGRPPPYPLYLSFSLHLSGSAGDGTSRRTLSTHTHSHTLAQTGVCWRACAWRSPFFSAPPVFLIRTPFTFSFFLTCTHLHRERAWRGAAEGLFHLPRLPLLHHSLACRAASCFCLRFWRFLFFYFRRALSRAHTPIKLSLNDTHFDVKSKAAFVFCLEACG